MKVDGKGLRASEQFSTILRFTAGWLCVPRSLQKLPNLQPKWVGTRRTALRGR